MTRLPKQFLAKVNYAFANDFVLGIGAAMFEKLKNAKNIGDKALQAAKMSINDVKLNEQTENIVNVKSHINQIFNGYFASLKEESSNQLKNDSAIIKVAYLAYSTIPLPVRLVVRKKRFHQSLRFGTNVFRTKIHSQISV